MNATKSWLQRARAQTQRASYRGPENRPSNDTSNAASDAGSSNGQNGQNVPPTVEKSLTEFLYKPPTLGVEDHYLIYVPRLLTCEERDEINEIRKQHRTREKKAAGGGQIRAREEHSPDGPRRRIDDDDD
ncbi:hypothetical protein EKO27_g10134 [Xylaria grammica]|uniref:Uncharacterized protein n=1 Tax=Xylaria grammica TaxID=363999 RepID=A0A439CS10_9PEZI|nr:hypothetical protein EKO27_g10134 [Xylaria grammica]